MKIKARLLVVCDSSEEGKFVYLKKKGDGTHSLTYSEEVDSREEGETWIKKEMRKVFGHRAADSLMSRRDLFFAIESTDPRECNFAVVVAHGYIPNAISACKRKELHLLRDVAKHAEIARPGESYDGSGIRLSAPAKDVIQKMAQRFHPQKKEKADPVTVNV